MSRSPISHPINSKSWWEEYHTKYWASRDGSSQTAHFMERLLDGLATTESEFLRRGNLEILDWGCAFGEGVVRLAQAFPGCRVAGLDYSEHAIEVARSAFPDLEFIQDSEGSIPRAFDVIVTSNCLEHFADPLAIVSNHLKSCRELYIALVPYREEPLCEYHAIRIDDQTLPEQIGDFRRIQFQLVETEARFWPGPQLLVVYASPRYLSGRSPRNTVDREREKWNSYYASIESVADEPLIEHFGKDMARLVHELLPDGGRILEAGSGAGQQSIALARTGRYQVSLLDFSAEALAQARRLFERIGMSAEFIQQDVMAAGTPEFDLVFNAGVLEHYTFDEQVALVRGMASRSARYVLVLVPNRHCYWYWIWRLRSAAGGDWPYGKEAPMLDFRRVFEASGLEPLGQTWTGSDWSENFINNLPGLDASLRDTILQVHRTGVIPQSQKGYLLAALAAKPGASAVRVPANFQGWGALGADHVDDSLVSSLADILAVSLAHEHRLRQEEFRLGQTEARRAREAAEFQARLDESAKEHAANARERETLQQGIAALTWEREQLASELERLTRELSWFQERLPAREKELGDARAWSATLDAELARMTSSRSYRLMTELRRIRVKVAPPGSLRAALGRNVLRACRKARQGPHSFGTDLMQALARRISGTMRRGRRDRPFHEDQPGHSICVPGLVSVVLPVYNQADLLAEAIESVLRQTYHNFELIVINDGSTDDVERILERISSHPQVRILNQENQKLPRALSNGFEFAVGEFWTWTSADNLMHPQQLSRQVEFLRAHPEAAMVYADYLAIDDRGEPLCDRWFRPQNRRTPRSPEIHLPRSTRQLNVVSDNFIGPCFLYRGWAGRVIGEYDPTMGVEDYDYWMRVNAAFTIRHLGSDELLYSYRVHDNSLTHQLRGKPIVSLCDQLIAHEIQRSAYYQRAWTIRVDEAMSKRLKGKRFKPHQIVSWLQSGAGQGPGQGSPVAPVAEDGASKVLYLIDSQSLGDLARRVPERSAVVACWFDSVDSVYQWRVEAAQLVRVAFAGDRQIAERLELLGVKTLIAEDESSMVSLATKLGNNLGCFMQTHPDASKTRRLPTVFNSPGQRPRVLIQVDNFDQGGLENVVLMMSQGLGVHGFQPLLLVLGRSGPAAARARELGLEVLHIPQREREQHYRTLLQEQSVGLVVAHYSTFGAPVAAAHGVPFVQVMHNSYVWFSEDQRAEYRQADPFVSAYVCVSAEVARYSDRVLGLPVRKMVIIPNGIDTQALDHARESGADELRAELGLGENDFVYLNVASLHAGKAQVALLQAIAKVVRARPDSKLILAGESLDPAYRQRVESLIAALDLSRHVSLVGQRADIMRFYWMADALVLPSYWEGWSLALTEAACTGLPFVATDVGGARELLQYSSGLLVKPPFGAITELDASRIGHLVRAENHQFVDDLARQLLAANGHSKRKPVCDALKTVFDQARAVENHANFYRWVMQHGDPAAGRAWSRMPAGPFGADGDLRKPGSVGRPRQLRTPGGSLRFDQAETSAPAHTARPANADLAEVAAKSAQADV